MPKLVSEISAGQQFQRSAENGVLADSQVRVFRIIRSAPDEIIDLQQACSVYIGDKHPYNTNIYCVSFDAKLEGESRAVVLCTFNYRSTAASVGEDKNEQPPDVRPANWSTSVGLVEMPVAWWTEVSPAGNPFADGPATNPAGDMYDGVSRFEGIVTINIEQFSTTDRTNHLLHAGSVNQELITLGSLQMPRGSVMFRGLQCKPHVEAYGPLVYRGWLCNYEFAYRQNHVKKIYGAGITYDADVGWDVVVPVTGFNVKCLLNAQDVEKSGMPLKHDDSGKIVNWPNGVALMDGVVAGQKARAMVLVHAYSSGGASQLPSAQPIPLNLDGSPRDDAADPKVILKRYRTAKEINFTQTFQLRVQ